MVSIDREVTEMWYRNNAKALSGLALCALVGVVLVSSIGCQGTASNPVEIQSVPGAQVRSIGSVAEFDALLAAHDLVLVDFYADWCGPCRLLRPTIEDLAETYDGRLTVVAIDVDAQGALADRYRISAIPNVKLFHHGDLVAEWDGLRHRSAYVEAIHPRAASATVAAAADGS